MMDKITLQRIEEAHPDIREKLKKDYLEINNRLPKGIRLRFAHVYRSNKQQDELFNKRPKVTNAKGGQSLHNYGLAFDIVMLYDLDGNGTFETASWDLKKDFDKNGIAEWRQVIDFFKSKGWEWGGDWKSFKDNPHFQWKNSNGTSLTWQQLKNAKKFIDNDFEYPEL
jgi:peptidoglycan L-alanyl-D-glutamate endopeptidase CwlK